MSVDMRILESLDQNAKLTVKELAVMLGETEENVSGYKKVLTNKYVATIITVILGVFLGDEFCGLAEMYGYRDPIHKISVGYRLLERYWGKGIAKEALGMMIEYLYDETDIEIITASTMVENQASANVLKKNGFQMVVHAVDEDWGYDKPTVSDKWIR